MSTITQPTLSPASKDTVHCLINAIELTCNILTDLMGEDVANTLNSTVLSRDVLSTMIASRIGSQFMQFSNVNKGV